jgi:hypothetical protein
MLLFVLNTNLFLKRWNYHQYLPAHLPIHQFIYRSVYISVYGENDSLSLPSFPMPKNLSLKFIHWPNTRINCLCHCHVYTSISFSLWLSQYLSLFLCQLYSPLFVVNRLSFIVYIDTSKMYYFYEACNMWTAVNHPVQYGTKCLTDVFSGPCLSALSASGLILFYYGTFQYLPPRTPGFLKEILIFSDWNFAYIS